MLQCEIHTERPFWQRLSYSGSVIARDKMVGEMGESGVSVRGKREGDGGEWARWGGERGRIREEGESMRWGSEGEG